MRYTWDPKKDKTNRVKHNVSFGDAIRIFERRTLEVVDDRFEYGEERIIAIGQAWPAILYVVYVERDEDERHIISARRAKKHEAERYWQEVGFQAWDGLGPPHEHDRRRNPRRRS
jgi:uncharacterized DUF497 family protein